MCTENHHKEGSFGNHINWIDIIIDKDKSSDALLMKIHNSHWTVGGMGLTGVIIRCSIQPKNYVSWINQKNIVNNNLEETINSFHDHKNSTYSVAWIDCLASGDSFGRSILMLGEHVEKMNLIAN